jgi:hypothetical protein
LTAASLQPQPRSGLVEGKETLSFLHAQLTFAFDALVYWLPIWMQ